MKRLASILLAIIPMVASAAGPELLDAIALKDQGIAKGFYHVSGTIIVENNPDMLAIALKDQPQVDPSFNYVFNSEELVKGSDYASTTTTYSNVQDDGVTSEPEGTETVVADRSSFFMGYSTGKSYRQLKVGTRESLNGKRNVKPMLSDALWYANSSGSNLTELLGKLSAGNETTKIGPGVWSSETSGSYTVFKCDLPFVEEPAVKVASYNFVCDVDKKRLVSIKMQKPGEDKPVLLYERNNIYRDDSSLVPEVVNIAHYGNDPQKPDIRIKLLVSKLDVNPAAHNGFTPKMPSLDPTTRVHDFRKAKSVPAAEIGNLFTQGN